MVNYMENDKQIVLDKLYEIIDAVEQLDSAVENVSRMIIEKLGNEGDQILENLSTVGDGIVKCIAGMDRAISRMNRLL